MPGNVSGDLLQVVGQVVGLLGRQVQYGRLGSTEEERVLPVSRVGGQQALEEGALAQQVQGGEIGALAGERNQQAGPEEQHVAGAHRVFPVVERECSFALPNQYHREDVGKDRRNGVDVYQPVAHLETGQTVPIYLLYLVVFCEFAKSYNSLFHLPVVAGLTG